MRPSVRLSALMGLPVVWAWTHDSVGLGEDGPTHQPVETYAALRAIPNLWFMRPGGRERDGVRVEGRARAQRRPRRALAVAPEGADARPRRARAGVGPRARRLRAVGVRGRARADPDRDRRRGRRSRSRPGGRSPPTGRGARRLDAVLGALRGAAADYRDEVLPPRRARAALRRARRRARLEQVGRRRGRLDLDRAFRRIRSRADRAREVRLQPSTTWSRARLRSCDACREGRGRVRPSRRPSARRRLEALRSTT